MGSKTFGIMSSSRVFYNSLLTLLVTLITNAEIQNEVQIKYRYYTPWYQLPNPNRLSNLWSFQMRYQQVFHYPPWPLPYHIGRLSLVPFSFQSNIAHFPIFKTTATTTSAAATTTTKPTTTKPNKGFMQFNYIFAKSSRFTFCN